MTNLNDVLIIGAGPAGVALAAALNRAGVSVANLNPTPHDAPWPNTYGIWRDELDQPHLKSDWLDHQWRDCLVYVNGRAIPLQRTYGLLNNESLQADLLAQADDTQWLQGSAVEIKHTAAYSRVQTADGLSLDARLVIDASGHDPVFARRPQKPDVAMQAAYGVVGRFSRLPVAPGQLVLMDYRADHLTAAERTEPPTFLYAMDLGNGRAFVEETSLAHYPAISFDTLQARLEKRLAYHNIRIEETEHVERCLFPMNLPMPDRGQPIFAYGGAASMVHPATGYQIGAALTYAPQVAAAIAQAMSDPHVPPVDVASAAWQALWPPERLRSRYLYLFGLANILRFDERQTQQFFAAFFDLPLTRWSGYLSNRLTTPDLLRTMWQLFTLAPNNVRRRLLSSVTAEGGYLARVLHPPA
ncbi:MAG: lycopene beta cyclase [Chloroflexota bacterium]